MSGILPLLFLWLPQGASVQKTPPASLDTAAQISPRPQEDSATGSVPETLDPSGLQLNTERRRALQNALDQRNYKQAEKLLVEEAERDPKSPRTAKLLVMAAGVFFLGGEYPNAVIAWKKAEAITPLDERSRFTLAMAYIRLNRREWARPELEKLAATQPKNPLYPYWLGRLDYDARNYSSAILRFRHVIELDPKMMRAYDNLGLCYDYLGQLPEAIDSYDHAVQLNRLQAKPSAWPHLDLAISLVESNRLLEAEKQLREAAGYDPRLPQAHFQLGRVFEMQGEHQAAIQSLQQAATLDPTYPEPHYLLGRIYRKLGEREFARSEIQRFQELKKATLTQPATRPIVPSDSHHSNFSETPPPASTEDGMEKPSERRR
jgi:tetratricopeptide (TPR) repeat protein